MNNDQNNIAKINKTNLTTQDFMNYVNQSGVTEEAIKQIKDNFSQISDWKDINELIPKFYFNQKMKRTGITGIFAASLELVKEGTIEILQKKMFEKIMIKKASN